MDRKFENVEMPEFLRADLEAFIAALKDPSKRLQLDCYMNELEGSVKACTAIGAISQELARDIFQTYLE